MPGLGELTLNAYGNQNVMFSGNPEMTNFYKVFKRHTHFSQESISIPLEGPNELGMDVPTRVRARIPRHADLITDIHFVFQVPDIYSKALDGLTPSFRWIHMLGPLLIQNVAIIVGGTKVQEFPGEWIVARATADYTADQYLKWRSMVGDVPELHSPEWGIHGKSPNYPYTKGEYPHVVNDPSFNECAPSIRGREIRVPLPFWFTEEWGRALPLVALQLHDVEIQITLRTLREVYRVMDSETHRDPVRVGRRLVIEPTRPTSYDPLTPNAYDNLTIQDNYESWNDCDNTPRNFYTDFSTSIPTQDGFFLNAHLEANYVYLTTKEREMFAARELQHLVHQVQTFRYANVVTRTKLNLDVHGLMQRILFYGRRTDAIESRNDYLNCTNWKSTTQAPYWPMSPAAPVPNSGRLVPYTQRDVLRSARMMFVGTESFEEKPASYFELEVPYHNASGQGVAGHHPGSIKPDDVMGPLYHIPFALNGSDHDQPSGSVNASLFREIQLEVRPWDLDPDSNYAYDFTVFVETLNTVKFMNGMAGLAFAI